MLRSRCANSLKFSVLTALILTSPLASIAQSNVYSLHVIGTIWELSPEQRAAFIADHSGSFLGVRYMHTKAFGWDFTIGGHTLWLRHISQAHRASIVVASSIIAACILYFLWKEFWRGQRKIILSADATNPEEIRANNKSHSTAESRYKIELRA